MTAARHLRAVEPEEQPAPDMSYEWQERKRIASKNWAAIHERGDRNAPMTFWPQVRRLWR